jgi:hypothetical protein
MIALPTVITPMKMIPASSNWIHSGMGRSAVRRPIVQRGRYHCRRYASASPVSYSARAPSAIAAI